MKLTNPELESILEELDPFVINCGGESLTGWEFVYPIGTGMEIFSKVIILSPLEGKRTPANKLKFAPALDKRSISFEGTDLYIYEHGSPVGGYLTEPQKTMVEAKLQEIITFE